MEHELRAYIISEAQRLSQPYARLPIPIGKLSYEQGIIIERRATVPKFSAHMSLPQYPRDWARVILPKRTEEGHLHRANPYERFCVAHELAHLRIFLTMGIVPRFGSEYWAHENICDQFARTVLLPEHLLDSIEYETDALRRVAKISTAARIPWMAAAKRISEMSDATWYYVIQRNDDCFKIISTSERNNLDRGRKLRGLLKFQLEKFMMSEKESHKWELAGDTIASSNVKNVEDQRRYEVSIQRDNKTMSRLFMSLTLSQ